MLFSKMDIRVVVMDSQVFKRGRLPETPGVYFFLGDRRKILYIGKATLLRSRVQSYFAADIASRRGPLIQKMIAEARAIRIRKTDSVLEALLLEAALIKKFKPPYNTDGKDGKSYNCVVITDENFPRVLVVRQKNLSLERLEIENCPPAEVSACAEHADRSASAGKLKVIYGPFPNGGELREALKIIRKIFPWRDNKCNLPVSSSSRRTPVYSDVLKNIRISNKNDIKFTADFRYRPCFNRQIGLCPGVCTGEITRAEYAKTIQKLRKFFSGDITGLERELEREMAKYAKLQAFEKANEAKRKLFAIRHIQDVALIKSDLTLRPNTKNFRIEAYDIAHTNGTNIVGAMAVVENGEVKRSDYRKFLLKTVSGADDIKSLREILSRRLVHNEWLKPNLIVVDGNEAWQAAAREILKNNDLKIPVVAVVKDNRHNAREILGDREVVARHSKAILLANSEVHRFVLAFHRKRRDGLWIT